MKFMKIRFLASLTLFMFGFASLSFPQVDFSYDDYRAVLSRYVDDNGMVNYSSLKADRRQLDRFVQNLGALDRAEYDTWTQPEKLAFWINSYNALTLKVIIDNYPIKSSRLRSVLYPKNSIRQISGVWDKKKFRVMGESVTLDHIEHEIVRPKFRDPRVHMALVCAALGCPHLRNEPYTGSRLKEQFDDQTRTFLGHPQKFAINRAQKKIFLSSIFKWFGDDFTVAYPPGGNFAHLNGPEKSVLMFVSGYLNDSNKKYIFSEAVSIEYLDYDWTLNQQ